MANITLILEVKDRDTDQLIIREEQYSLQSLEEKLYRVERAIINYEKKGCEQCKIGGCNGKYRPTGGGDADLCECDCH